MKKQEIELENSESMQVEFAETHATCIIAGKALTTFHKVKLPNVELFWIKGDGLMIKSSKELILIPAANVKIVKFKTT